MVDQDWINNRAWDFNSLIFAKKQGMPLRIHRTNGHWAVFAEYLLDQGVVVDLTPDDPDFFNIIVTEGVTIEVHKKSDHPLVKPTVRIKGHYQPVKGEPLPAYAGSW